MPTEVKPPLTEGAVFAGHRIVEEIGRGGMGIVYCAVHLALNRPRAVKLLAPELSLDASYAKRFQRESRLAASVEHPNLVTIHHAGEEEGRLYMAMQYVDGVDLGRLLTEGPVSFGRAAAILVQLGAGLDAAHSRGLVHRDVKPENVLLSGPLQHERVYLTDFGIGTIAQASSVPGGSPTGRSGPFGSTDYVAPEQIVGGPLDHRADVYSLGCVAFHMLTGRPPFETANRLATLAAHGSATRPRPSALRSSLGVQVDGELAAAMAIDPNARPESAGAFAGRLAAALVLADDSRSDPRTPSRVPAPSGRTAPIHAPRRPPRRWMLILLSATLALLVSLGAFLIASGSGPAAAVLAPAGQFDVPPGAVAVAAGGERVWVASRAAGRIKPFDPRTGLPLGKGYAIRHPNAVALGFGYLWVTTDHGLLRLDLDRRRRVEVLRLADAAGLAAGSRWLWVLDRREGRAIRIDPAGPRVSGDAYVGRDPQAIAVGGRSAWVANTADGTISRIDQEEVETRGKPIPVGGRPTDLVAAGDNVWVVDNFQGRLIRIGATAGPDGTPEVEQRLETGARPRAIAVGFDSVWVANGEPGTVWRFAPGAMEPEAEFRVGADPADLDIGNGHVWSADSAGASVTRISP